MQRAQQRTGDILSRILGICFFPGVVLRIMTGVGMLSA